MTTSTATLKPLSEVKPGDRILKLGYLPRSERVVLSITPEGPDHFRFTYDLGGMVASGIGKGYVPCEVAATA